MQTWQLAKHLIARGRSVEILTTCCRSFDEDWSTNAHRPGFAIEDGVPVRRFRVDRRDRAAFNRADNALLTVPKPNLKIGVNPVSDADAGAFASEGIKSAALLEHLSHGRERYTSFLFMQYLYGTTLQGLPLVADRAFLQPTLHDEAYAYIPQVAEIFQRARGVLFISTGEYEVAQRLFGPGIIAKSCVVGAGVDPYADPSSVRSIQSFDPRNERFVLYLGRQEPTKNIDLLVSSFRTYRSRRPFSTLKLVLAGQPGHSHVNSSNGVVNFGLVEDAEKELLLRHCRSLAQPSVNESYSRTMVEAWMHGRPVVVHADCIATAAPTRASGGGWVASGIDDWSRILETIDESADADLGALGARGRAYAEEYGAWDKVIARYEAALRGVEEERFPAFTQIVSDGDRYGREYADALERALQFRRRVPDESCRLVHLSSLVPRPRVDLRAEDVVVCHRPGPSVADERLSTDLTAVASIAHQVAASTAAGRDLAVSAGQANASVAAICVDPRDWDMLADGSLIAALQDGRTNIVYAGEFAEFQHLGELVEAFLHYLTLERHSRLVLLGLDHIDPAVHEKLTREIETLRLNDDVVVTTALPLSQQLAVYRTSRLFWSMDGRGDLGRHLLNAMWFDIPILAYKNPTASFFAGASSVLFTSKQELLEIAALAKILTSDEHIRAAVVSKQRERRALFSADATLTALRTQRAAAGYMHA
jgi:glycosyltransferase involved in cell wall biosynthesis